MNDSRTYQDGIDDVRALLVRRTKQAVDRHEWLGAAELLNAIEELGGLK
jgi:hypothetical protein